MTAGGMPSLLLLILVALGGCEDAGPGVVGGGSLVPLPDAGPADIGRRGDAGPGPDGIVDVRRDAAPGPDAAPPPDGGAGRDVVDARADAPPRDAPAPPRDGAAPGDSGARDVPPALPAGRIAIATWNTHLFFDDVCDSGSCGWGDFEAAPSTAEFQARAAAIADAIRRLDADIVLLQEIENDRALTEVFARLYPEYSAARLGEVGYAASVDVAVVVRGGELRAVDTHRGQPIPLPGGGTTSFSRELLECHVRVADRRVIVFVAHFRSMHADDPARRLAEARAAHDRVTAAARAWPDALVVLGGDLNDVPGSAPLDALESSGSLRRVTAELPDAADATYWYDGPRAIDHLLVATGAAGAYVPGTAAVVTAGGGRLAYGGSDHAALRAEFGLPERPEAWDTIHGLRRTPAPAGTVARVVGVVTARSGDTFALQLPDALHPAGESAAWSGIYVAAGWRPVPARGAYVTVTGALGDWFGQAQLADLSDLRVLAPWVPVPEPVVVAATSVAAGGALAAPYNAVLVDVAQARVTAVQPPPSPGDQPPTNEFVLDDVLRVDDFHWQTTPLPAVGTRVAVRGVLRWRHGEPKLLPRAADDVRTLP
jgi:endonuclease/exonuclease/phosphatase family metal-dependent hydrolase